ncbi:hypothetical protein SSX86_003277 [Deinandra increscens subsp. villosa]|uniref:Uncharacterized protein n=1 Tax=Deinandra increscens subsp. villosa TaxID=3103831 RepID=A0AAP0DL07_9ASTR
MGLFAQYTAFPALCQRHLKPKPSFTPLHLLLFKPYSFCFSSTQPQSAAMKAPLEESDVGISCYISPLSGFRGILKQRYSDFVVNEVDLDGNVVHLTSLEAPTEVFKSEEPETKTTDQLNGNHDTEIESFRALAGESDANSLKEFIDQISSDVEDGATSIVLSPSSDKVQRTAVHNFFKERLKFLVTDTIDGPEPSSKCIRVRLNSGGNNDRGRGSKKRKGRGDTPYDSRGSDHWPDHLGKFLRFHLCKENKDTQEALGVIGKMLGIQPRSFGFSGTKDKRAVTTQQVTVFKQRASKLASLNKRLIGIKVGDFCYVNEGLLLGQLHGNRFTVTLRGVVTDSEDTVKAAADALGKHGFINYFGMQRFGTGSVPTHLIGAKLLRGEWKTAVSMILDPRDGDILLIHGIREYYKESGDIDGTLRQLPRYMVAEKAILQCMKKSPGNYLQALKAVPRTLRMMQVLLLYVHSYQSYLWNHATSMRVQKYGTDQLVLGDLVYCSEESCNEVKQVDESEHEETVCNDSSENNVLDEADALASEGNCTSVKVINNEDLASGRYTYTDVVLPLPGSRVIYPQNDIEQCYQDLANKDGVSLTESVHSVKEFSLTSMTGAYRRVFGKAKDFEWELIKYRDISIPLTMTDLDMVTKASQTPNGEAVLKEDESLGEQLALKLSFTLAASCYATMAIRELLKTSTSVSVIQCIHHGKMGRVTYDKDEKKADCACMCFTRIGYLCSHVFFVFRVNQIDENPNCYINRTWCQDVLPRNVYTVEGRYGIDSRPETVLKQEIMGVMNECLEALRCDKDGVVNLSEKVKELKQTILVGKTSNKEVDNTSAAVVEDILGHSVDVAVEVTNPDVARTKGCGRKRRISGPGEKAMEKPAKVPRFCNMCQKYVVGHDSRNCKKLTEAAKNVGGEV